MLVFFAGAGVAYGSIKQEQTPIIFNAPGSYSSLGPKISIGLNFYPVPEVGKSILKLELAYTSNSYKIGGTDYYDSSIKSTYSMQQHTISVIPQFLYNIYNTDPFKFYIDAGFAANFSSYGGNSIYNSGSKNTQTDIIGLNDRWLSIPLKAGVVLKKNIDVSVTYILPESITDNHAGNNQQIDKSLNLQNLQLCVGYNF